MTSTLPADRIDPRAAPRRQLTLLDSTSIIVGIIIGSSIYKSTPAIAGAVPSPAWLVGVWLAGGLLTLVGALCYAELANAFPKEGGDYVYLTQAFGRKLGFLFAWAQFWIVRPGSVGGLAYVFAAYANELWPLGAGYWPLVVYAVGAIIVLSGVNLLGVREGKWTQNLLTIVKYLGLAAVVVVGFCVGAPPPATAVPVAPQAVNLDGLKFAMIMIFYAYSGWNEMAYVGSEVRDPHKNILRALVLGTLAAAVLYVLLNLAFLHALGFEGLRHSKAVAAEVLTLGLGDWASRLISVLICISALGAINGMIFTGARIYYAMGTEHRLYAWLGQWSSHRDTPLRSLVIQGLVTAALAIAFGEKGFEDLVVFTAPAFWIFLFLVGLALFVLRRRHPDRPRPYRVPWYPLLPIVFCLSSLFMAYSSLDYAISTQTRGLLVSTAIIALGLLLSFFDPPRKETT
ncbi:MAG: amino acid permease [Thermoguttaceae bacterium]|jgi:amino acid transporter